MPNIHTEYHSPDCRCMRCVTSRENMPRTGELAIQILAKPRDGFLRIVTR